MKPHQYVYLAAIMALFLFALFNMTGCTGGFVNQEEIAEGNRICEPHQGMKYIGSVSAGGMGHQSGSMRSFVQMTQSIMGRIWTRGIGSE